MSIVNRDQLVKERAKLLPEDQEYHYIMSEMIEPLIGGTILGGFVMEQDDVQFPVLSVMVGGKKYQVCVSRDDEMNDGGRLIINDDSGVFY